MEKLRVGLVGCGAMGEIVGRQVYPRVPTAALCCVVDVDRDRAVRLGASLGLPAFDSLTAAVAELELDGVDVRTPHARHVEVAVEAAGRGLALLVEKPLATTVAGATVIIEAAAAAGVTLAVAENYPHLRAVTEARGLIDAGALGEVLALRCTRVFRLDGVWVGDGWRNARGAQAGVLLDQGTHQASLLRRLAGPLAWVSATPGAGRPDSRTDSRPDDTVMITAGLVGGLTAQLLLSWVSPSPGAAVEAEVFGREGRLDVLVDYDGDGGGCRFGDTLRGGGENYYDSHLAIIDDWADAVRAHRDPLVTGREALQDLRFVEAALTSLRSDGARVALDPAPPP